MSTEDEVIWSECRACKRSTKHQILGKRSKVTPPEYYHEESIYYLLECNGCTSVSYRTEHHDYESYRQYGPDEYEHDISVEVFPHHIKDHNPIDTFWDVPTIVDSIYKESLLAIQEGAFTLAGLGLRATIEAICNDKDVKGKNLQVRINAMNRSGMISKSDAERLHAIRFMGNDAAHEIKKAKEKSVLIALKIIEHILLSVYVFETEVNKHLETPLSSIDDTLPILESNLSKLEENSTFTLTKWLGSSRRRVLEKIEEIETDLIAKIEAGELGGVETIDTPEAEESSSQWYKKVEIKTEPSEES
ncbi:DUF4145 domain-containing protein [Shewanella algae]|uniref:DUF4145 domain-containing protein n=1 Tax=Shewanella algae TaxID=38313 RepID=UPI00313EA2F0